MNLLQQIRFEQRRTFLGHGARGLGSLALTSLLNPAVWAAGASSGTASAKMEKWPGVVNPPHRPPQAKRVIFLCMAGGPSHLETFDYRPKLAAMNGKPMPESFTKGQPIAQLQGKQLTCLAPQHQFKKFGRSGQEMCELFPHLGAVADKI